MSHQRTIARAKARRTERQVMGEFRDTLRFIELAQTHAEQPGHRVRAQDSGAECETCGWTVGTVSPKPVEEAPCSA